MIRLKDSTRQDVWHSLLAFLLALGLIMPSFQVLGLLSSGWIAAGAAAGLVLVCFFSSRHRLSRVLAPLAAIIALGLWLWLGGGLSLLRQTALALLLQAEGVESALPLYRLPAALAITVVFSLLAWLITGRGAGPVPACAAVILCLIAAWQAEDHTMLLLLFPAAAVALTLLALAGRDGISLRRVLPAMGAVSLLALALTPAAGAVIPEWKTAAEELRQRILDEFFFS